MGFGIIYHSSVQVSQPRHHTVLATSVLLLWESRVVGIRVSTIGLGRKTLPRDNSKPSNAGNAAHTVPTHLRAVCIGRA